MKNRKLLLQMIIVLLATSFVCRLCAQEQKFEIERKYTCVDYDADTLIFPAGISDDFKAVLGKLADIKDGKDVKVNMIHIGGSHVQADIFTHRVRTNFSKYYAPATGSRGCLFPFATLKTNAPSSYRLKTTGEWRGARNIKNTDNIPLGIMGAAIVTSDPSATVTLQLNTCKDSVYYDFNSLTLLGDSSADDVTPVLNCNGSIIQPEMLFLDSSVCYRFELPAASTSATISFQGLAPGKSFTLRGIIPESNKPGVTYTASGVNGASVPKWLGCTLFTEELKICNAELAIFAIGINDAASTEFKAEVFKDNYRKLLAQFKEANPNCSFIFITNNDCFLNLTSSGKYINPNTGNVRQAFMELAEETQGAVFDVYDIMGGRGSSNVWVRQKLMNSDHVHFLAPGYNLLGDMLFSAIDKEVEKITQAR